jgi:hypothetical protein
MSDATASPVQFNATAPFEERRQSPRSKMTKIVYMNLEAENGGILLDISLSGLSFQLAGPLAVENQVSFRLLAEGIEDIEVLADVAWLDENRRRGGLRFGQLPEKVLDRIRVWVGETPAPITRARDRAPLCAAKPLSLTQVSKPALSRPSLISELIPYSLTREPSRLDLPHVVSTESNLGVLANPLRSAPNLRPLNTAHHLQFTAQPERHLGTIALAVFVSLSAAAGAFVFANRHKAGELLIHLGELVSGDSSRQFTDARPVPASGTSSFPSPGPSDRDAPQAASAQTASNRDAAESAIAAASTLDVDRPEEQSNSDLKDNEVLPGPSPSITDQSSRTVTSSSPSPSESATNTGELRRGSSSKSPRADAGHTELVLAQRYLRGSIVPKDRDMAAHLLWVAVGEGNPQAELELADLYLRSDGVSSKNCAQARILLNDSSNNGNIEAGQQLAKLRDYGCR